MDLAPRLRQESIDRLKRIFNRTIESISTEELAVLAKKMLFSSRDEYLRMRESAGIKISNEHHELSFEHDVDAGLLYMILEQERGRPLTSDYLKKIIEGVDLGVGYFNEQLKGRFLFMTEDIEGRSDKFWFVPNEFAREQRDERERLEKHLKFDADLRQRHKIPQPKLFEVPLKLDATPLALDFTLDDKLVILGQRDDSDRREDDYEHNLRVSIFDFRTLKEIVSRTTMRAAFNGAAGMIFSFLGSVSVGSNGIIYACGWGDVMRFNQNLDPITDNTNKYLDAVKLLVNEGLIGREQGAFQVLEHKGIHYFALCPNHPPRCYNNVIAATDGEKLIGGRYIVYSPNGGAGSSAFKETPRMQILDNKLFYLLHSNIAAVDISLTDEATSKQTVLFKKEGDLEFSCAPSNHCVDKNGILWVDTELPGEIVPSIKAYDLKTNELEFLTHIYPENCAGGFPAMRSMAISKSGILAYSDMRRGLVNFYTISNNIKLLASKGKPSLYSAN